MQTAAEFTIATSAVDPIGFLAISTTPTTPGVGLKLRARVRSDDALGEFLGTVIPLSFSSISVNGV